MMWRYFWALGQNPMPGSRPVRSYHKTRPLQEDRSGTGTAFDFFYLKVFLLPHWMYFSTRVPRRAGIGSFTQRTTRFKSAAVIAGRSRDIGLCTSGRKYLRSTQCSVPSPASITATWPVTTSLRLAVVIRGRFCQVKSLGKSFKARSVTSRGMKNLSHPLVIPLLIEATSPDRKSVV